MKSRGMEGFSLVEIALALGITSFCAVALMGMLPVGLNSTRTATEQTSAMNVATAIMNDLQATPRAQTPDAVETSSLYQLTLPAAGVSSAPSPFVVNEAGRITSLTVNDARYLVTITMKSPPSSLATTVIGQVQPTMVDIRVSWPAAATLQNASGSVETFTAVDRWPQ